MFKKKGSLNEALWGWAMVAPTIICLVVLNIIPIFQTLKMSFHKSGDFGRNDIFVGFENYQRMLGDAQVWQATWNTFKYTLLVVPATVVLAILSCSRYFISSFTQFQNQR